MSSGPSAMPKFDDLLERERELDELTGALKKVCSSGTGSLIILAGAAGMGKSRLLAAAREQAGAADMTVLTARGLELERDVPFGVALRLLERARPGKGLVRTGPGLGVTGLADGVDRGNAQVHGLRQQVVDLVSPREEGPHRPALIAVDDVEWADGPSLRFLLRLTADLEVFPLTMILAMREREPGAPSGLLDRLAGRAVVLRPAALSAEAVAVVVRGAYPHAVAKFTAACARASDGNPFFLHEILTAARADGIPATAEGAAWIARLLPESVLRSVLLRVRRVPGGPELAAAVAVLGDGAALHHAAGLAGLAEAEAEQTADALARAGILRPDTTLSFSHPLIAAAVHDDMPPMARSRAHRQAAGLLLAEGAAAEEAAVHLLVCRAGNDEAMAAVLGDAAEQMAARGEYASARRLLERALAERQRPERRAQLGMQLALVQAAVGAPDALNRLDQVLTILSDPRQRARILHALARLLFARSETADAVQAIRSALAQLGDDDPLRRELATDQLILGTQRPDLCPESVAEMTDSVRAAQAGRLPANPAVAALVACQLANAGQPVDLVRDAARAAVTGRADALYGITTGFIVYALVEIDELSLTAQAVAAAVTRARQTGSLIRTAFTSHWRAMLHYYRGELAAAVAAAEETLEACRSGWDLCRTAAAPLLAKAQLARGDLAAAAEALRLCSGRVERDMDHALILEARGQLALACGEPGAALANFEAAGGLAEASPGMISIGLLPWRSSAACAAMALGRRDYAASLAEAELSQARRTGARRSLGVALRAAGLAAGGERGVTLLREAAAVLAESPALLERAQALADLGAAYRRAGQQRDAREPLRRGAELAQQLGAVPLAARASRELAAAGGRRRAARELTGVAALTPSELRVARLAAEGFSTPQIAQALVLAQKTVEWHLGHAYRKLGIGSRRELRDVLGSRRGPGTPAAEPWTRVMTAVDRKPHGAGP